MPYGGVSNEYPQPMFLWRNITISTSWLKKKHCHIVLSYTRMCLMVSPIHLRSCAYYSTILSCIHFWNEIFNHFYVLPQKVVRVVHIFYMVTLWIWVSVCQGLGHSCHNWYRLRYFQKPSHKCKALWDDFAEHMKCNSGLSTLELLPFEHLT